MDKTSFDELLEKYKEETPKGEFVMVIAGKTFEEKRQEEIMYFMEMSLDEHMELYLSQGIDKKEAMKRVAKDRGVSKRDIYNQLLDRE